MTQATDISDQIIYRLLLTGAMLALSLISNASAQTTALTYQGKLNDNANPATGNYDFQFKLFDTATVGTGTQQDSGVIPLAGGQRELHLERHVSAGGEQFQHQRDRIPAPEDARAQSSLAVRSSRSSRRVVLLKIVDNRLKCS